MYECIWSSLNASAMCDCKILIVKNAMIHINEIITNIAKKVDHVLNDKYIRCAKQWREREREGRWRGYAPLGNSWPNYL